MTYTDRYVSAVLRHLPSAQHAEIDSELRALIADAIDAQHDSGVADAEQAERAALEGLGHPEKLAAGYSDRPLYLIGPKHFLLWKRLLILVVGIVAPIIAVLAGLGAALEGRGAWSTIGQGIGAGVGVAMAISFWMTVVFATLERYGADVREGDIWTVKDLPEPTTAKVTRGETITEVALLALTAAFLAWLAMSHAPRAWTGLTEPILAPGMGWWIPTLLVLIACEIALIVARQMRGHWTRRDAVLVVALNLVVLAVILPPLLSGAVLNPAAAAELGWPDANSPISLLGLQQIIAGVAVPAAAGDIWGAVSRARVAK